MSRITWKRLPLVRAVGRARRRLGAYLGEPAATLVYHLDYRMPDNPLVDPRRGERILDYLLREGCLTSRQLRRPEAVSIEQLARVHDYGYLEQLGQREVLERVFGEPMLLHDIEQLITVQRRMVAGTVLAARLAVKSWRRGRPVVNLGGGLHHAQRASGAGFCLFNDVAIAIAQLRSEGYAGKILVVDLDLHQGDGTRRIFADDLTVYTCSVHATTWDEGDAVADLDVALGSGIGDAAYLEALQEVLPRAFREARPDLVFYVAGADIAADDKLGSWRVSADGVLTRDRRVLELIGDRAAVWLLAGGYGDDAWRHTARSLADLLAGHDAPIPSQRDRDVRHFRRIARQFTRAELTGEDDDDILLKPEDLMLDLVGSARSTRLLGYYSRYGVELAFERYGVLAKIRAAGYPRLVLELDTGHSTGERIRVLNRDEPRELLLELVLSETSEYSPYRLLSIEWLMLQNPRARPTADRPLLPGQQYPGLGCLGEVVMMLMMACERLGLDGLLFCPAHYHVAAQAHGLLAFFDPADEARFAAIGEALTELELARATQLVHGQQVLDQHTGEPVRWQAVPMALPVSKRLKERFEGADYERAVVRAAQELRFRRRE